MEDFLASSQLLSIERIIKTTIRLLNLQVNSVRNKICARLRRVIMVARVFRCRAVILNAIAQKDSKERRARMMWKNVTQCPVNTVERVEIRLDPISK